MKTLTFIKVTAIAGTFPMVVTMGSLINYHFQFTAVGHEAGWM